MWFETSFFSNPFSNEHYSRERKVLFALDQVARLTALDAAGFAACIQATRQAAEALGAALGSTGAAVGTQRGATQGTDAQLQAYRVEVSSLYNLLLARAKGNKAAPLLVTVFGGSVQRYTRDLTKTNAPERLDELGKLLAANQAAIGPDLLQPVTDAAAAYLGGRSTQLARKAGTDAAQLAESQQELALDQALWLNLGTVVARYPAPGQESQRRAAADFSLLQRRPAGRQAHTEAAPLAAHALENLVDSGLKPATPLRLHNPGATPLRFALAATLTAFPATGYREVQPGETLTLTAADLGDAVALPYLNVQNPTAAAGAYEVRVG